MGFPGEHPCLHLVHLLNQFESQRKQLKRQSVGIRIEDESPINWPRGNYKLCRVANKKEVYGNSVLGAARFESIFFLTFHQLASFLRLGECSSSGFRCNLRVWFPEFTGCAVKLIRLSHGNQECWGFYNSCSYASPLNYLAYFDVFLPKKGSHGLPHGLGARKIYQENADCSESHL